MPDDRVSVVIPTYNYGHFVEEAIQSALSQTYENIEVIVVDDGSIDDTSRRLKHFGSTVRYYYQSNKGLSAARNAGIRLATGKWIAFLDADDVWHREKIERQLESAKPHPEIGLIGSPPAQHLPVALPRDPDVRILSVRDFLFSSRTGPSGTLIRRQCFDHVGMFDENLRSIEDRDMWLRVAARTRAVQVVSPCWWYRPHDGQMSKRASTMFDNYKKVLTKFFSEHPEYSRLQRGAWSYLYLDAGWAFLDEGERLTAMALLLRSVSTWPWSFGDDQLRSFPRGRILARLLVGDYLFMKLARRSPSG